MAAGGESRLDRRALRSDARRARHRLVPGQNRIAAPRPPLVRGRALVDRGSRQPAGDVSSAARHLRGGPALPLPPGVDLRFGETRLTLLAPSWQRFRPPRPDRRARPSSRRSDMLAQRSGQSGVSHLVLRSRGTSPTDDLALELALGNVAKAALVVPGLEAGEDRAIAPPALQLDAAAIEGLTERD